MLGFATLGVKRGYSCPRMDDALILARAQFGLNIGFHILFP